MTATSPLSSSSKSVQHTVRKGRNSFKKQQQQEDRYYDQDETSSTSSSSHQQQRRVSITLPPPVEHSQQALHRQQQPEAVETSSSSVSSPIKPALQATNTKRRYARRGSKCPSMFMMIRPLIQDCTSGGVSSASPSSPGPGGKQCALSILTEALNLSAADTAELFN